MSTTLTRIAHFPVNLTRLRGLAPRHLRTAILSFFVHAKNRPKTLRPFGLNLAAHIKKRFAVSFVVLHRVNIAILVLKISAL
ncbi:hypothetical protein ACH699_03295 [Klebsiella aerogenes]|uniref:hypothetical protein n=1 Tax=Klebsiella aerogenes TaxID=548 RepID=UPI00379AD25C